MIKVLLQIFTKPLGDRPTIFVEFIQRVGNGVDQTGEAYQKEDVVVSEKET